MQHDTDLNIDYIPVNGPAGLWEVLNGLLEKTRSEQVTGPAVHYLRYELGSQISFIKVDLNADPVQFWYYDLLGRPPTKAVKETIAKFLWEKCGEQGRFEQAIREEGKK